MKSPEKSNPQQTKDKIKNHPRRFSDDQIKSLESIFKKEPKLEPRKKLQIARDLDLKPRQVAIWFQNKRARWRSKQIEHEYNLLQSNYDALSLRFEELKAEKMSLEMKLRELSNLVKNLENVDSSDHPNEEIDEKKIIGNMWWMKREERELEISQTWRNLSSDVDLFDNSSGNSNWWSASY